MTFEQVREKFEGKFCQDEVGVYFILKIEKHKLQSHYFYDDNEQLTFKMIDVTWVDEDSMKEVSQIYNMDKFCQENIVIE